ncbi:hypothetical protein JXB31_05880 [Candidatus Woesearchaeota archaeon]|nr:hypothetical protein [Candidatus Woesearchaeota archaeon]
MAKLKHDIYLENLCTKISSDYQKLMKNVPLYSKKKRRVAEIDILAFNEKGCDVYEVKCSYRIIKARKQLHRIRRFMPDIRNTFFFCGQSGNLELVH